MSEEEGKPKYIGGVLVMGSVCAAPTTMFRDETYLAIFNRHIVQSRGDRDVMIHYVQDAYVHLRPVGSRTMAEMYSLTRSDMYRGGRNWRNGEAPTGIGYIADLIHPPRRGPKVMVVGRVPDDVVSAISDHVLRAAPGHLRRQVRYHAPALIVTDVPAGSPSLSDLSVPVVHVNGGS